MGIATAYKRWRHTRGYGVHSPFAYSVVRRVIRPGRYSYYGYHDIEVTIGSHLLRRDMSHVHSDTRMLLRLAAMLHPHSAYLSDDAHPAYYAALKAADSRMMVVRRPSQAADTSMICTSGDTVALDTLVSHIGRPGNSIAMLECPDGWKERIFEAMPEGLLLFGRHNIIAINRPGMQKLAYSVRI